MSGRALRWLLSLVAGAIPAPGGSRLTIVRHHRVYADGERPLYPLGVSESVLASQVEVCVRAGLAPVSVQDGLAALGRGGGRHIVAFSFDDGYADNVTRAVPVLARFGARATFYLTAGLMESRRAPWWDELAHALEAGSVAAARVRLGGREISLRRSTPAERTAALVELLPLFRVPPETQRERLDVLRAELGVSAPAPCELADWNAAGALVEAGMEVGAHTLTHPFLTLLTPEQQQHEMAASAAMVHERLGARVTGVAYPNGDHDARTIAAARAAGFEYAVSTRAGDCAPGAPAWSLPRRALSEGACRGPGGRFSARMTLAELHGAFDRLRGGHPAEAS